jgi:hypothetical protein
VDKMPQGLAVTIVDLRAALKGTEESNLVAFLSRDDDTGALSPRENLTSVHGVSTVVVRARNS